MTGVKTTVSGAKKIRRQLSVLKMSDAERAKKHKLLAREVQKNSKRRIRLQRSLNGGSFAKRKGSSRKKMLRGLSRKLIAYSDADNGTITYSNRLTGSIAKAHQEGIAQVMTASKARAIYGVADKDLPATRKQAKALRAEGYKIRRKGSKGYKPATLKWIRENLTQDKAGVILRLMRDEKSLSQWTIPLPARPYLGATPQESDAMATFIFDDIKQQIIRR